MKREDLLSIFRVIKAEKQNFVIKTNVANGCGINGIDFSKYYASYTSLDGDRNIKEISFLDECMLLTYWSNHKYDESIEKGEHIIALPFDSIVYINIIVSGLNSCFPEKTATKIKLPK